MSRRSFIDILMGIGNLPSFDLQFEKLFREEGVGSNAPRYLGRTYLRKAIADGNISCVKALLRVGADLYPPESDQEKPTAFHFAAAYGETEILQEIINHCTLNNVDMKLEQRGLDPIDCRIISSPLLLAGFHSHSKSAIALMLAGANVNARNDKGMTILHYFCKKFYPEGREKFAKTIKMALELGADIHLYCSGVRQTGQREPKQSQPIHIAAICSFSEAILLLLDHGANIEALDGDGMTPLLLSVKYFNHFEYHLVDWKPDASLALINSGADVCAKDGNGSSCMQILKWRVEELLGRGPVGGATWHGTCAFSIQLRNIAAVIVALVGAGDYNWAFVPVGCPGLARNLFSVWKNAPDELRCLFKRLEVDVQEQMRAVLQGLHRHFPGPGKEHVRINIVSAMLT